MVRKQLLKILDLHIDIFKKMNKAKQEIKLNDKDPKCLNYLAGLLYFYCIYHIL